MYINMIANLIQNVIGIILLVKMPNAIKLYINHNAFQIQIVIMIKLVKH